MEDACMWIHQESRTYGVFSKSKLGAISAFRLYLLTIKQTIYLLGNEDNSVVTASDS